MEIILPDLKDAAKSKTIVGTVLFVAAVVANAMGYIDDGVWFQAAIGASLALAGFGVMGVIKKILGPLYKIAGLLPAIEKAAGLPGTDVSKLKVDPRSMTSKSAMTGFTGLVVVIAGYMLGYIDDKAYEASMAVAGGLVGIGGRLVIQKAIIIVTRLLQALPVIEMAINALTPEENSKDDNAKTDDASKELEVKQEEINPSEPQQ